MPGLPLLVPLGLTGLQLLAKSLHLVLRLTPRGRHVGFWAGQLVGRRSQISRCTPAGFSEETRREGRRSTVQQTDHTTDDAERAGSAFAPVIRRAPGKRGHSAPSDGPGGADSRP